MITRFKAKNYKNVDADVECGPVNILIGPNNCGKSNFLRALGFLSDLLGSKAASGREFPDTVKLHGGALMKRNKAKEKIGLIWEINKGESEYTMLFEPGTLQGEAPSIHWEQVTWAGSKFNREFSHGKVFGVINTSVSAGISSGTLWYDAFKIGTGKSKKPDYIDLITTLKAGLHSWRFSEFRPSEMAAPSPGDSEGILARSGSNLNQVIRWLEKAPDDQLDRLVSRMQQLIPGLKRILTHDAAGTHWWTEFRTDSGNYTLAQMSDGTVVALAIAALLLSPPEVKTICIDEPELNIHPAWLMVIASWMQQLPKEKQLFFSTHSPELLDNFTEGFQKGTVKLLVFSKPSPEGSRVRTVDPTTLKSQLDEGWKLGDLYRIGEPLLGGWPW
jgi:predicted ATPase